MALLRQVNANIIIFSQAPCDNGEKIVKYHVEVTDGLHSNNNSRAFYTSAQKQFKVPKLTPARSYVFRLAAENKIGKR